MKEMSRVSLPRNFWFFTSASAYFYSVQKKHIEKQVSSALYLPETSNISEEFSREKDKTKQGTYCCAKKKQMKKKGRISFLRQILVYFCEKKRGHIGLLRNLLRTKGAP